MPTRRSPGYVNFRLAHQVKERRKDAGFSQEGLAGVTGLHRTYVGAIERAERNVSLAILEALAEGLDCDPSELISG